jgi:hypothetical protein
MSEVLAVDICRITIVGKILSITVTQAKQSGVVSAASSLCEAVIPKLKT